MEPERHLERHDDERVLDGVPQRPMEDRVVEEGVVVLRVATAGAFPRIPQSKKLM